MPERRQIVIQTDQKGQPAYVCVDVAGASWIQANQVGWHLRHLSDLALAAKSLLDAIVTNSDGCAICRGPIQQHLADCPVPSVESAIAKVKGESEAK